MSPYRAPAAELVPRTIPRARLGRICNALGLSDFRFVRRWLGGRWERWTLTSAMSCPAIRFRVLEWTDASNLDEARDRHAIHASIMIEHEEYR